MAHANNIVLKYLVCVILLAVLPFLLMLHFSSKYKRSIHNRDIKSTFTIARHRTNEQYIGQQGWDADTELSPLESLQGTTTNSVIPIEKSTLVSRSQEVILNHDAKPKEWWDAMLKRQTERKFHLRQMCETRYNQSVLPLTEFVKDKKRLYSFYYIDEFKLMYSFVHKVGSTNWARLLRTATKDRKLKRLYRLPKRQALWRLQNYTSFLIVRHPLVRLLSAYRDKFVEHHIPHYKSIGRRILKKFRKDVTKTELKRANNVRFDEFLGYIAATRKHQGNTHWDHSILRNEVCLFDYDIIAKLETGDEDTKFILKTFRLDGVATLGSQYQNYTGHQDIFKSFYSQIPTKLLNRVIHAYESDFLLFNYSMNIEYTQKSNLTPVSFVAYTERSVTTKVTVCCR